MSKQEDQAKEKVGGTLGINPVALAEFLANLERQGLIRINREKLKLT